MLIEAESLLNDGAAIVVFEICHMILVHPASIQVYVSAAVRFVFGAPALGLGLFLASWRWLVITDDPIQDTLVTVCTSYLCYFVAEAGGAKVSGVLSVLTMGICMAGFGHTAIHTEHAQHMLHAVWTIICWVCDTVIFMLAGAIIVEHYLSVRTAVTASDWGLLFALYFCCLLIRGFVVLLCAPVIRYSGYGMQWRVCSPAKFCKYMFILSWGGLRGAVGLVLAMIVAQDTHLAGAVSDSMFCQRVLLFTGGMVALTTLINAASLESVIAAFGLAEPSETEKNLKQSALRFLWQKHDVIKNDFKNRQKYPDLANVDWLTVDRLVGPQVLFVDEYVRDKDSHIDELLESREGGEDYDEMPGRVFDSMGHVDHWDEHHFLGRYLTSLRCSYSSQYLNGLLSPLAYRRILRAVSTALDHSSDGQGSHFFAALRGLDRNKEHLENARLKKFEWGWLEDLGYFGLPIWLRVVQVLVEAACFDSLISKEWRTHLVLKWTRTAQAQRMEVMLAVARAHEDTLRCEEPVLRLAPPCVQRVLQESRAIKHMAENKFAELQYQMPDISCAVRTRQTCQLMLDHVKDEIQLLHSTAQISDAEFEAYEHIVFHRSLHLTHILPKVTGKARVLPCIAVSFSGGCAGHSYAGVGRGIQNATWHDCV